jgi:16S rRNA (guanine527-N7)-methyltransferase
LKADRVFEFLMQTIQKYFSNLNSEQLEKLSQLYDIYGAWNSKINVISRKDFENFYVNHVLHSLSILKFFNFVDGTRFLDVGTGGGFPGIPLSICLPNCQLVLSDSIAKKMKVVEDIATQLKLKNVTCITGRAEQIKGQYDFITGRAVTALPDFANLIRNKISKIQKNAFPNGILYLKGGEFDDELVAVNMESEVHHLNLVFEEEFFETKKLVYLY